MLLVFLFYIKCATSDGLLSWELGGGGGGGGG